MTAPSRSSLQPLRLALSAALLAAPVAQANPGQLVMNARLPFAAQLRTVMPSGTVAGMRVAILQFDSALPSDEAIAQTLVAWSDEGRRPVVRSSTGAWQTVSTQDRSTTWTLQIRNRPGGGSTGLLSQWLRGESTPPAQKRLMALLPTGVRAVRIMGHQDAQAGAATLAATSELDINTLWNQLKTHFSRDGFQAEPNPATPAAQGDTRLGFFRDGSAQLAVTVDGRRFPAGIVMTLQTEVGR